MKKAFYKPWFTKCHRLCLLTYGNQVFFLLTTSSYSSSSSVQVSKYSACLKHSSTTMFGDRWTWSAELRDSNVKINTFHNKAARAAKLKRRHGKNLWTRGKHDTVGEHEGKLIKEKGQHLCGDKEEQEGVGRAESNWGETRLRTRSTKNKIKKSQKT